MIRALQALHHGSVRPATSFGSSVRSVEGFEQSRGHHELGQSFLDIATQYLQRQPNAVGPVGAAGANALLQLTRAGLTYNVVNRGDIVPADVSKIDLPSVPDKIHASDVGGIVSDFLNDWENKMLKHPPPSE